MVKALFWDLQGTLGGDAVASLELFEPFSFSKDALKLAKDNGYKNIVITKAVRYLAKDVLNTKAPPSDFYKDILTYFITECQIFLQF